jgi:hypothetical protein
MVVPLGLARSWKLKRGWKKFADLMAASKHPWLSKARRHSNGFHDEQDERESLAVEVEESLPGRLKGGPYVPFAPNTFSSSNAGVTSS